MLISIKGQLIQTKKITDAHFSASSKQYAAGKDSLVINYGNKYYIEIPMTKQEAELIINRLAKMTL